MTLPKGYGNQFNALGFSEGIKLSIRVNTWRQDENDWGVLVGVRIYRVQREARRMDKGLIPVSVHDEVHHRWKDSISSDDFDDDQLSKTVTFLVPFSGKRFFLGVGSHVPFLPFFGVMDESPYNIGEVWQLL